MSIDSIRDTVARLTKRFGEARAEEICDELKIKILYIPMGQTPESCKGFFLRQSRKKVIVLNADLPKSYRRIILPHELGHGVLHGLSLIHIFRSPANLFRSGNSWKRSFRMAGGQTPALRRVGLRQRR